MELDCSPAASKLECFDDGSCSSQQSSQCGFDLPSFELSRCHSVTSSPPFPKRRRHQDEAAPAEHDPKRSKASDHDEWAPVRSRASSLEAEERNNASQIDTSLAAEERLDDLDERLSNIDCQTPLGPRFVLQPVDQQVEEEDVDTDEFTERLSHLYDAESLGRPDADYLEAKHGPTVRSDEYLDAQMRTTVVSWLVEVGLEYDLHQESVFLAITLLDRYLSATEGVMRKQLQLISVACLLVAAKHEEERTPSMNDLVHIAENSFQVADLVAMERQVLEVLAYRLTTPTAYTFWTAFTHASPLPAPVAALACYLIELSLLDNEFLRFAPSETAAAAILLALGHQEVAAQQRGLSMPAWSGFARLAAKTGYRADELGACVHELCSLHARAATVDDLHNPFTAVKDKYANQEWQFAAHVKPVAWLLSSLCEGRFTLGAFL